MHCARAPSRKNDPRQPTVAHEVSIPGRLAEDVEDSSTKELT